MVLFDKWEAYLSEALNLQDFSISLEVEDGTITGRAKILAGVLTVYLGIGQYGSFVSGLQTIKGQVSDAASYLSEQAHAPYQESGGTYKARKRGGMLGQFERIFDKVQRNEMSVEEAMQKVEAILGEEAETSPEFIRDFQIALQEAPRAPEQFLIELEEDEEDHTPHGESPVPRSSSPTRPKPTPILHNLVQIWKESKKGKRKILVTQI